MAISNKIRIRTSVEVLAAVQETVAGNAYESYSHDTNAGGRPWGGKYDQLTYADAAVAYWDSNVIDVTDATTIASGGCFETTAVTDGTLPATVKVISVEFVSAIGTAATVYVTIAGVVLAGLVVGESIVIPISAGEAIADVKLHANSYTNGTNEATVNVMVAGA